MFLMPVPPAIVADATYEFASHDKLASASATQTFSGVAIGTAADNRTCVVAVTRGSADTPTIDSVTIGGNTMSFIVEGRVSARQAAFYAYDLTTGTTADIVINMSASVSRISYGCWALFGVGAVHATAFDDVGSPAGEVDLSLNVPAGGVCLAAAMSDGTGVTTTYDSLDEDYDALEAGNGTYYSGASKAFAAAQTPLAINVNATGTSPDNTGAAVSWGPG